jgi:hypothetical protein
MPRQRAVAFIRSNVLGLAAIFIALGGTAIATQRGPTSRQGAGSLQSVSVAHLAATAPGTAQAQAAKKKKKKTKRGPAGPPGPQGVQGPPGPTFGVSLSQLSGLEFVPQLHNGPTLTTPSEGKLFAFAHIDRGKINCSGGTGLVRAGLFVDGAFVPGTRWDMATGVQKSLSFTGVTADSVPAGTHHVEWGVSCVGGTAIVLDSFQSGFGAIVLGD